MGLTPENADRERGKHIKTLERLVREIGVEDLPESDGQSPWFKDPLDRLDEAYREAVRLRDAGESI